MKNLKEGDTDMDDQSKSKQELISELAILSHNFEYLKKTT